MIRQLVRLLRPGDWVKNVFVLPAPIAAAALEPTDAAWILPTAAAFVAFSLLASGVYAINDVVDADSDRRHPIKRTRPVASGEVTPGVATVLGVVLLVAGIATGFAVNLNLGWVLCTYAGLQALYNLRLKRVVLVDVVTIALGFALRAAAGAVAIEEHISVWLVLCVFFLCLYLAFIKRLCDISSAEAKGGDDWRPAAQYLDRGELNWLLGVSGVLAVVTYLIYALSEHARAIFGGRAIAFALMTPLVLITIHRFYRRANRGTSDSPLAALFDDRAVMASVALFAIGTLAAFYVPLVEQILGEIFADVQGSALP